MRFRVRTLRGRLIAGLLVLLTIACAIVGVVTTLALRTFLVQRLDQQLTAAGTRYAANLEHPDGEGEAGKEHGQAVGTFGARLAGGQITQCGIVSDRGERLVLAAADRQRLAGLGAGAGSGPQTIDLETLGKYRVIAAAGQDGDVLITGLPMRGADETLRRLEVAEMIVFAAVLLGTGVAGATFVRLTLRPLRRIAATAMEVSRRPLGSGEVALPGPVPDHDPGTEVGQVGTAFNRMLEHVGSALAQRHASEDRLRRFVADASHELRTPLAAIRSHAELAGRDPDGPGAGHALRRIEAESARMGHLVDDLLLLARLDAGRPLADDRVDLTRLAIDTTSDARAAGPDHHWRLDLPGEPVVIRGDEYRLHQVLGNLLTNARTHTPAGTNVTVRVAAEEPGTVTLDVTDDGPGIPAELQKDVFERFVRGDDSRSRKAGSTGLGLAIVSAVVHAHGGTVALTSAPARTQVRIRLPEHASPG